MAEASGGDGNYLAFEDVLRFSGTEPSPLNAHAADAALTESVPEGVTAHFDVAVRPPRANLRKRSAVALGGLAGNNAHGAGFLEALRQSGKSPQMITCTSGQILWTYWYLADKNLKALFEDQLRQSQRFGHNLDLNLLRNIADNDHQRIRLALAEFPGDLAELWLKSWSRLWSNPLAFSFFREAVNLWPARTLVNQDDPALYSEMADCFNAETEIGVAFNAYDFVKGVEVVYLNQAAARLTGKRWGTVNGRRSWVVYERITPPGIQAALSLYEYGFNESSTMLDGAYFRDIILSEIPDKANGVDRIAVVRPLAERWIGPPPRTWAELKDMQTEVAFNGTYAGERERIREMNDVPGRRRVGILELLLKKQRGWWDYIFEDQAVFDAAFTRGQSLLRYL